MKKIQVAVIENDSEMLKELKGIIEKDEDLELVGVAIDGKDGYTLIKENQIDVLIMELFLKYIDGFALLDLINENTQINKNMRIVMATSFVNNAIIEAAFKKGIDYYMLKPYNVSSMVERIKDGAEDAAMVRSSEVEHNSNVQTLITKSLIQLGIPASLKGYRYVATGIQKATEDNNVLDGITKILYPEIAKKYDSTPQRVEKAIRHAIEVAWKNDCNSEIKEQFKMTTSKRKMRPTNSEFIAIMSQYVRNSHM